MALIESMFVESMAEHVGWADRERRKFLLSFTGIDAINEKGVRGNIFTSFV